MLTKAEKWANYMREYRRRNVEAARTSGRKSRDKLRADVLALLGGVCIACGFSDPRALQVDHIAGGGEKERRRIGNTGVYVKIRQQGTEGYQLLCANCNMIKGGSNA